MKKFVCILLAALMVLGCLAGVTFAADAEAVWTDGTTTFEGTVKELTAQVTKKGGTLKLLKDVHMPVSGGYAINSNKTFTLDLNGHKLSSAQYGIQIAASAKGTTVITDSVGGGVLETEKFALGLKGGGIQIKNATLYSKTAQTVAYYSTEASYAATNLIENSTIITDSWCCLAFNNTEADQVNSSVTIKNSTLINTKSTNVIDLQAKPEGTTATVILGEGNKFYSTKNSCIAGKVKVLGETLTKGDNVSVTLNGNTYSGVNEFTTPAKGTVDLSTLIPAGDPAPAAPSTPATPSEPAVSATGVTIPSAVPFASAKATWTLGGTTVEGNLSQLLAEAAKKGGTVTLKENAQSTSTAQYVVTADQSITVDLGGFTMITEKSFLSVTNKAKGITVIKNGTLLCKGACVVTVRGGALQVKDATLWTPVAQAINYYPTVDTYNQANIIENSTVISEKWFALSFNNTDANQEKACFAVKNSTLINTQKSAALGLQTKPEGSTAQVALGENVKLYSAGGAASHKAVTLLGASLSEGAKGTSVSAAGATFTGLNEWTTSADAVDLAAVIPGAPFEAPAETGTAAAPAAPSTSTPSDLSGAEKTNQRRDLANGLKKDAPEATLTPLEDGGSVNVGIIIAAVAAVAVIAAAAVVVLKKKKK